MKKPPTQPVPDAGTAARHVALLALPDAAVSTLSGIFDVMNAFTLMPSGSPPPFHVEIVGLHPGPLELASRVPIMVQRAVATLEASDIVIVPSVVIGPEGWRRGRYPELVDWLRAMHQRGALLCSACSG